MWNWNIGKTVLLGVVFASILFLANFELKTIIVISLGFGVFVNWLVEEINFLREVYGSNIEKLENEVRGLSDRLEKLEKKKTK